MSDWGFYEGAQRASMHGANASDSGLTAITASGSNNTKGPWTELISAAPFAAQGIVVYGLIAGASILSTLIDIGIGGAGSEVVVVPDMLQTRMSSANTAMTPFFIPLHIPEGARVAARFQHNAAPTLRLGVCLVGGGVNFGIVGSRAASLGPDPATSKCPIVDPGAVANTKGAWTELTSSAPFQSSGILLTIQPNANYVANTASLFDIGIGAAGSEQILLPDIAYNTTGYGWSYRYFLPLAIPAGVRVAARAQSASTATNREAQFNLLMIG